MKLTQLTNEAPFLLLPVCGYRPGTSRCIYCSAGISVSGRVLDPSGAAVPRE